MMQTLKSRLVAVQIHKQNLKKLTINSVLTLTLLFFILR